MFERIKCYKNLKKYDKFLRGTRKLGEIIGDKEIVKEANEALCQNEIVKKKMWTNPKMARNYNTELLRKGL